MYSKIVLSVYLTLLLDINVTYGKFYKTNVTDFSQCKVEYTRRTRNYSKFYYLRKPTDAELAVDFHFSVLAISDAHILLAEHDMVSSNDAVYEIVIGAGGNSFSDIRRRIKGNVRVSYRMAGLLSPIDITSFWIHVYKNGVIDVGKEGEEVGFLTWTDTDLLDVKVFSFSIWDNAEAKWFFDCPRENENGNKSKETKPPTELERLRKDIINVNESHDGLVYVNIQLSSQFISLDERSSILNLKGQANVSWNFAPIKWNPGNYSGLKTVVMQHGEIWKPELVVANAIDTDHIQPFVNNLLVVNYNGQVIWQPSFDIFTYCNMDGIENWPNDAHTCDIDIGTWLSQNDHVRFQFDNALGTPRGINNYDSEWKIIEILSQNFRYLNGNDSVELYLKRMPPIKLQLQLKRNTNIFQNVFHTPLLVILTLMLINFWASPFEYIKLSIVCAQFLITTIATIGLATVLPAHREKIPYLVYRYSGLVFANIISLIITIVVINLSRNRQQYEPPHAISRIIKSNIIEKMLFLPELTPKIVSVYPVAMETIRRKSLVQDVWIRLGMCIDRIAFIVYLLFTLTVLFAN